MNKTLARVSLVAAAFFAGCAQISTQSVPPISPDQYPAEIARLEAVASEKSNSSEGWQANYELAQRYMAYNNPARDYAKSLANLQIYLSHNPAAARDPQLQNLQAALKEIQTLSHDTRVAQLNAKLQSSRKANRDLKDLNTELNRKIDMLKTLDHAVEEKRKTYSTQ